MSYIKLNVNDEGWQHCDGVMGDVNVNVNYEGWRHCAGGMGMLISMSMIKVGDIV